MDDNACILCKNSIDDVHNLGTKYKYRGVTVHHHCLLLSSNLEQNGGINDEIFGFLLKDIRKAAKRAAVKKCYICQMTGANISCCKRNCRKSFHLSCGLKHKCRFEFNANYESFCKCHNDIKKPSNIHKIDDLCAICFDQMGKYDPMKSIKSPCCNPNKWYHKSCLVKYAEISGFRCKCPLCENVFQFRDSIARKGVFIPETREAKWEEDSFYEFDELLERTSRCSANECKCSRGRNYKPKSKNVRHSFIYCYCCGANGIHRSCSIDGTFLCEECEPIYRRISNNEITTSNINGNDHQTINYEEDKKNIIRVIKKEPLIDDKSSIVNIEKFVVKKEFIKRERVEDIKPFILTIQIQNVVAQ